jgi:hypothetical protein
MKYFETSYVVGKPINIVFDKSLDIVDLHNNIGLFGKAYVTTNELEIEEIGKSYSVVNNQGKFAVRCILTLVDINKPYSYTLTYTYETKNEKGEIEEGCQFLPWETMTCIVSFKELEDKTSVTTLMHANGIESAFGNISTKILGVVNFFQQLKYNKRASKYIEQHA